MVVEERPGSGSPAAAAASIVDRSVPPRPDAGPTSSRAPRLAAFVLIAQALEERRNSKQLF